MISDFHISLHNPQCNYYPFRGRWGMYFKRGFVKGTLIQFILWYFKRKFKNIRTIRENYKKLKETKIPFVRKGVVCEFRNEGPQVDFHLLFGKWKRVGVNQYNHRKIAGVKGFSIWYYDQNYMDYSVNYDRLATFSIETFEDFYKTLCQNHSLNLDGHKIKDSHRYKVFHRNIKCMACGLMGKYYALEVPKNKTFGYHFNLYGVNEHQHEVLMTIDHIIPLAKGGHNGIGNLQTMCMPCNVKKGDT